MTTPTTDGPTLTPTAPATATQPAILVVDDALDTLRMVCDALIAEHYVVLAARDATEALARFDVTVPDGVLLDARLTLGLPRAVTAATGIDAMVHAIEAYTSVHLKNPMSDLLAREALQRLGGHLLRAVEQGGDVDCNRAASSPAGWHRPWNRSVDADPFARAGFDIQTSAQRDNPFPHVADTLAVAGGIGRAQSSADDRPQLTRRLE